MPQLLSGRGGDFFRDLLDTPISVGTVHNRLETAAVKATEINQAQDLSGIEVGLLDEIYQANKPVLVGVDAASTYCYLLQSVEHRDEERTLGMASAGCDEPRLRPKLHDC